MAEISHRLKTKCSGRRKIPLHFEKCLNRNQEWLLRVYTFPKNNEDKIEKKNVWRPRNQQNQYSDINTATTKATCSDRGVALMLEAKYIPNLRDFLKKTGATH